METKSRFMNLIKSVMRQLWLLHAAKHLQLLFMAAGAFSFIMLIGARIVVIPYLGIYWFVSIILIFVLGFLYFYRHKPTIRDAAHIYDHFIGDDRAGTSLSFLNRDEEIYQLQRNDAIKHMKAAEATVLTRKKKWIFSKWLTIAFLLWSCSAVFFFIPNATMQAAKQKEKEIETIKKAEKKLKKFADNAKNKEVKKTLQEIKKDLKSSKTAKEALNKLVKQNNQLELKQLKAENQKQELQNFQNQLKNAGLNQLAKAISQNDQKKVEQQMKQLKSNLDQLTKKQKQALKRFTNNTSSLTKEELAKLEKQLINALKIAEEQQNLQLAQDSLQESALEMQQEMMKQGLLDSKQIAFAPDNQPTSQNNQGNTSSGNQSNGGQTNGKGTSNGKGSGGQTGGQGKGSGNGNGQGGSGKGGGNGIGSGAGQGQGTRKFLTIPEKINGTTNIEKDSGKLGKGSQHQYSSNGPVLKGNVRPYEEAYGKYEQAFRESTERVQLPTELEELVKQYFSNLNPD
ncbi:hypothetical protein AN964_15695 [Heyndrickxia shackletonii]|uniref:Uncharacterized protein n=2 Tax=Heyndrickxia shackletonii TaxID=157838 RepID=A0A0Q3TLF1_9BACI|nr:hypothetical protein [Heyndrickxia shackletonii]KQL54808.1 hypothetical protein AN964_15695 [Heyndrickxia shackletonii]NEZ01778.1 hypothetical protein [Heyndrickxia shackletonii]